MIQKLGLLLLAGTVLVACGGGGEAAPSLQSASLAGTVIELEGQTVDRSGVEVTLLETGEMAVTGADGRFSFTEVPPGSATLAFASGQIALLSGDDEAGEPDEVEDPDGADEGEEADEADEVEEADEDDEGNPRIRTVREGDDIEVRITIRDGEVVEFHVSGSGERKAIDRLDRPADSPNADVTGKVKVESEFVGDEEFEVEVEHLAPGTVVEVFLADPEVPELFTSIGTAPADEFGEAELERETEDGDALPLGVSSVDELRDFLVEVRLAETGELLLFGTVPALPAEIAVGDTTPGPLDRARARGLLTPAVPDAEGYVEIRSRPEDARERFKIEAEHLEPGTIADFFIESPDGGLFVRFGSGTADAEGEIKLDTNDGLPMPLGVTAVAELVGLEVRVERDDGQLLLAGTVPALVAE